MGLSGHEIGDRINRETAAIREVHLILDNYATHKHPKLKAWLERHPRFHFHSIVDLQAAIKRFARGHDQTRKPFVGTAG